MRHFYFRLMLGFLFIVCFIFSVITLNLPFALLYLALSVIFLSSAHSIWKNGKDDRR